MESRIESAKDTFFHAVARYLQMDTVKGVRARRKREAFVLWCNQHSEEIRRVTLAGLTEGYRRYQIAMATGTPWQPLAPWGWVKIDDGRKFVQGHPVISAEKQTDAITGEIFTKYEVQKPGWSNTFFYMECPRGWITKSGSLTNDPVGIAYADRFFRYAYNIAALSGHPGISWGVYYYNYPPSDFDITWAKKKHETWPAVGLHIYRVQSLHHAQELIDNLRRTTAGMYRWIRAFPLVPSRQEAIARITEETVKEYNNGENPVGEIHVTLRGF